jgi:hypothetical protein
MSVGRLSIYVSLLGSRMIPYRVLDVSLVNREEPIHEVRDPITFEMLKSTNCGEASFLNQVRGVNPSFQWSWQPVLRELFQARPHFFKQQAKRVPITLRGLSKQII